MTNYRSAIIFTVLGYLLASTAGSLRAAPDKTLGMALMAAAVDFDGSLIYGAGAKNAERTDSGDYNVYFNRSLKGCHHVASVSGVNSISFAPKRGIHSRSNDTNEVRVLTYETTANTFFDTAFQVLVFCPT